jgi:hypothetical protein
LHKSKFALDKVICYVDRDVEDICKRLNLADKNAVAEYLIEFIQSSHDLRKSANALKKFLQREYPGEWGPLETQPTQGGAGGSKKRDRSPPSKQVFDCQRKSLPLSQSAQASGNSRGIASQSRSTGEKLKVTLKRKHALQKSGSTRGVPEERLARVPTHLEVQTSQSKDERHAF